MFLMFTLGRPDVFAPDDRGLQLANVRMISRLFRLGVNSESLAEAWAPYRTTACLHLWHSLDNMPKK